MGYCLKKWKVPILRNVYAYDKRENIFLKNYTNMCILLYKNPNKIIDFTGQK